MQLRDGTVVRGEIIRDTLEEVEFKVDTVQGKLPRSQVYRVVLELDFDAPPPPPPPPPAPEVVAPVQPP